MHFKPFDPIADVGEEGRRSVAMEGNTNTFVGSPHSSSHGWVEVGFGRYSEVDKDEDNTWTTHGHG